jgi:hypothetical protein
VERGRDGYPLRQRVWASFIGFDLPARSGTVPTSEEAAVIPRPSPQALRAPQAPQDERRSRQQAGRLRSGWFALPPLPSASALTAAGGDPVVLETSSPDSRVGFLVRRRGIVEPEYSLELVVRGVDALRPLVSAISYPQPDGSERVLLVPVVQGRFGPAASYVRLPGFGVDTAWSATDLSPVALGTAWDGATVNDSVRAALNEATRDAWRQVRELVEDDVRGVIDSALR